MIESVVHRNQGLPDRCVVQAPEQSRRMITVGSEAGTYRLQENDVGHPRDESFGAGATRC